MPKAFIVLARAGTLATAGPLFSCSSVLAQTVWSGLSYTFTKADFGNPEQAVNQDQITSNVWISRPAVGQGLVNVLSDRDEINLLVYTHGLSPAGTEWATGGMLANLGK